jgi:hypothetical protein
MASFWDTITGAAPYKTEAAGYGKGIDTMQQAVGTSTGYLNPYLQTGTQALGQEYAGLQQMQDPTGFYNKIMDAYQQSPATQFQMQQGLNALKNTAAATGYTGSGKEMQDLMKYSQDLTSQGQQSFLQNILGIHGQYLAGLQGLGQQGQQAGTTMGGWQMQGGQDIAALQAEQAKALAQAQGAQASTIGSLMNNAGSAALAFL